MNNLIKNAILRLDGTSTNSVSLTKLYLGSIENIYVRLSYLEDLSEGMISFPTVDFDANNTLRRRICFNSEEIEINNLFESSLQRYIEVFKITNELMVETVQFSSPGFWEFLGSINPLEVIRTYLNDRHERKKDLEWRNILIKRKMVLENDNLELINRLKKTELVEKTIEAARKANVSEELIAVLFWKMLHEPLAELDKYQDWGMVTTAKIKILDPERETSDAS